MFLLLLNLGWRFHHRRPKLSKRPFMIWRELRGSHNNGQQETTKSLNSHQKISGVHQGKYPLFILKKKRYNIFWNLSFVDLVTVFYFAYNVSKVVRNATTTQSLVSSSLEMWAWDDLWFHLTQPPMLGTLRFPGVSGGCHVCLSWFMIIHFSLL